MSGYKVKQLSTCDLDFTFSRTRLFLYFPKNISSVTFVLFKLRILLLLNALDQTLSEKQGYVSVVSEFCDETLRAYADKKQPLAG